MFQWVRTGPTILDLTWGDESMINSNHNPTYYQNAVLSCSSSSPLFSFLLLWIFSSFSDLRATAGHLGILIRIGFWLPFPLLWTRLFIFCKLYSTLYFTFPSADLLARSLSGAMITNHRKMGEGAFAKIYVYFIASAGLIVPILAVFHLKCR